MSLMLHLEETRRLARYTAEGGKIVDVPAAQSMTPCSLPSRRAGNARARGRATATSSL